MFKKIEIWILYVVVLLGLLVLIGYGALIRHEIENRYDIYGHQTRFPALTRIALILAEIPSTLKHIGENTLIQADRFPDISGFIGESLKFESYLLLSRYDGDLGESVVELVDLRSFEILHTWNPDITAINKLVDSSNPIHKTFLQDNAEGRYLIYHPLLSGDGSLTFQAMGSPLIKIDYCSNLVWQNQGQGFHHSIERDHENNLWVPTHTFPYIVDEKFVGSEVDNYLDDTITKLSPDGQVLFQKSVSEILIENGMEYLLFSVGGAFEKDPVHLNDIQPALTKGPYWEQGDVFLSLRNQSMIILYRPKTNEIIWKATGQVFQQHDVTILDDHRISIFNNNSKATIRGQVVDGHSEVVVYDFQNATYTKYLDGSLQKYQVRSTTDGRARILDNGDLFFEEENFSRTLYFDADGSLQWQHVNRANDGNIYHISWSRLLYKPSDIAMVQKLLASETCEDE